MKSKGIVKFVDLFAGLGGIRLGFEQAFNKAGYTTQCVLTSEIKPAAIKALTTNFGSRVIRGDITTVDSREIEDFDFLLAGFPCQAFSVAGKQRGFLDTRGTLFFDVEGLVTLDRENPQDKIGRTLATILHKLEDELNYQVSWKVLDAQKFGVAQSRNRIYIVGTLNEKISLSGFGSVKKTFKDVMETGLPTVQSRFTQLLFDKY